jgi:hypothetical protein
MVLTVRVVHRGQGHTRRRFLSVTAAAAATTTVAGCGLFEDDEKPEKPDALQPLLSEALALAAVFDQAALVQPGIAARVTPLADDHRAHAAELARMIGRPRPSPRAPASASAAPVPPADLLRSLRSRSTAGHRNAVAAVRAAPPERVMVVGSIAACRATHAEALR